ncbi:MAG TPA: hypothetical protein VI431_01520 [Candidatus Acidoferrum sp.]
MLLYSGQLRIGGGIMLYRNNVLLLLALILTVLISALVRFPGHQKYFAILVLGLALAAFHIAVPGVTSPSMLFRLFKNARTVKNGARS